MAGIDSVSGFVTLTLQELKALLEASFRESFGASFDVRPESNAGQIIGISAERLSDLWEACENVYTAFTPDGAVGPSLDNVAAITGTIREPATPSTGTYYPTGTNGTLIVAGKQVSVVGTGAVFETMADTTLATATAWANSTAYTLGQVRRNGSTQRCYICITAGTSAGSGGPDADSEDITDGTAHWRCLGDGAAYNSVAVQSVEDGPYIAAAGTLRTIETPVSGWSGGNNNIDAVTGTDIESDAALRLRRESELRGAGRAAVPAIQTRLMQVDGVTAAVVFDNPDDTTDADGLPPHSIEALVTGGDDTEVAQAVFENVAAGIQTYGSTTEAITDTQGVLRSISFSRPTAIDVYVVVTLEVDPSVWNDDSPDEIEQAIVDYGDAQLTGRNVVASAIEAQCFTVAGVLDATCYIGTSPSPATRTTIQVALREYAEFDTSRISVTATPGVP